MRDKIMCNGVDVSGCEFYGTTFNCDCIAYCLNCKDKPNCYYKQLKREQERALQSHKDCVHNLVLLKRKAEECKEYAKYLYETAELLGIPLGTSLNAKYSPEHLAVVSATINNYIRQLQAEQQKTEALDKQISLLKTRGTPPLLGILIAENEKYKRALEEIKPKLQELYDSAGTGATTYQERLVNEINEILRQCEVENGAK